MSIRLDPPCHISSDATIQTQLLHPIRCCVSARVCVCLCVSVFSHQQRGRRACSPLQAIVAVVAGLDRKVLQILGCVRLDAREAVPRLAYTGERHRDHSRRLRPRPGGGKGLAGLVNGTARWRPSGVTAKLHRRRKNAASLACAHSASAGRRHGPLARISEPGSNYNRRANGLRPSFSDTRPQPLDHFVPGCG